jgi:organic hydroperoxide reductase OsmC/OhrA
MFFTTRSRRCSAGVGILAQQKKVVLPANTADQMCPYSKATRGNIDVVRSAITA